MRWLLVAVLLLACRAEVGEPPPPPPECDAATPHLALGVCVDASGAPCSLDEDEEQFFQSVDEGDSLPVVRGPQGAWMVVIAAQARDILPGDPDDRLGSGSPLVELTLLSESGDRIALLRRRSAFSPVAGDEELFFHGGFFVVLEEACPAGELLEAHGELVDAAGALRCGDLAFRLECP